MWNSGKAVLGVLVLTGWTLCQGVSPCRGEEQDAAVVTEDTAPAAEAKEDASSAKPAKAYSLSPAPVALGKLPHGAQRDFSIRVGNLAQEELSIKGVRSSCPCLKLLEFTEEAIAPGAAGEIKGRMVADEKEGQTRKIFYIHLSDKRDPIAQVVVNVEFTKADGAKVVLSNDRLEFGKVKADADKRLAVCRIMNFGDQALKITEIVNDNPALEVALDSEEPVPPHKGVTLRARLDPSKAGKGEFAEEIYLMTDSPLNPAVLLKVTATVE